MALLTVSTDDETPICTFIVPAVVGWGEDLARHLTGILNALQDAIDKDAGLHVDPKVWPRFTD